MILLSNIAKLYDGRTGDAASVKSGVDLFLKDGLIHELRPHAEESFGDAVTVIDASSWTVTPGLVDCHGHVTLLGISSKDMERSNGLAASFLVEKVLHLSLVEGGVTTMRDIGGATHLIKRLVDEDVLIGPRLKIAICMLSTTGGHADFRGPDRCHGELSRLWTEGPGRPSGMVDGPWECRKRVREIAACGADLIKICTSPGVASPGDKLEHQDFQPEEIEAICQEAEARGLMVAAHAHSMSGIELAIKHGVKDIQHVSFMDERLVEMAHAADCTVTPTSWIVQALPESDGLSPFVMEKAKMVAEVHAKAVEHARSGGLRILAGTDPVLPGMHGRNSQELTALMKEGMDSVEAWYSMTGLGAREIGQTDTGTLESGRRADLLISEGDVITDPALLTSGALLEVVKDGVAYRGAVAGLPQRSYRDTTHELWS
jgi:imidazolonepropionase-like amidohydrolase